MMTPFPPKTPTQMRLEAEPRANPRKETPLGKPDPARRPIIESETGREIDATTDWLAHVAAGRITVR
jgi:hypothetical protein